MGQLLELLVCVVEHPRFAPRRGAHKICALHSALTPAEQREAFKTPGGDVRKIVVATNVAETSVTIPDVVVGVDSGRVKERQWDPRRGMASLDEGWVSRASARQRAGRAGRVRPGKCYAMFTSLRASKQMRSHQVPELHRVPLTEVVLQIKKLGVGGPSPTEFPIQRGDCPETRSRAGSGDAAAFLAGALEPPAPAAVAAAIATLREIGGDENARADFGWAPRERMAAPSSKPASRLGNGGGSQSLFGMLEASQDWDEVLGKGDSLARGVKAAKNVRLRAVPR